MANKKKQKDLSIKEVSEKLEISEATVRKYIKDFNLDGGKKTGNKFIISEETIKTLVEIMKLRNNGLTLQEIKNLICGEKDSSDKEESEEVEVEIEEVTSEDSDEDEEEDLDEDEEDEDEDEEVVVSEDEEVEDDPIVGEEIDLEEESDDDSEEKDDEEESPEATVGEKRKKLFNSRYVERQISSDSKRVMSIRQRLKNPNLSEQERIYFEEALERRVLFLDGWKHILRWVSLDREPKDRYSKGKDKEKEDSTKNESEKEEVASAVDVAESTES